MSGRLNVLTAVVASVKALVSPVAFGVSALALDRAGRVLLVRHRYVSGWHLPGGGVGRGEPPAEAVMRELREEVGLVRGTAEFAGLFTRKAGLATNVIALYRVRDAEIDFHPNAEVVAVQFADPAHPPPGTAAGTARRLAEFVNTQTPSAYW
ncbi:MAG TPA: NUDIX domain-containing protein [Rhizomicrobium sp.]|nr:NUDIX domain-containing protein [Rhizomicrobium sp.]